MKLKVFIASSVKSLEIARALKSNLFYDSILVDIWDEDIFKPSSYALETLTNVIENYNLGIFIFGPDDEVQMREEKAIIARDNVIFELGLFIGKMGRESVFVVKPNDISDFKMPTDLLGITTIEYKNDDLKHNSTSALSFAAQKIRDKINSIFPLINGNYQISYSEYRDYYFPYKSLEFLNNNLPSHKVFEVKTTSLGLPNRAKLDSEFYKEYKALLEKLEESGKIISKSLFLVHNEETAKNCLTKLERVKNKSNSEVKVILTDNPFNPLYNLFIVADTIAEFSFDNNNTSRLAMRSQNLQTDATKGITDLWSYLWSMSTSLWLKEENRIDEKLAKKIADFANRN